MFEYYILLVLGVELMIYLALRIIHAFAILFESNNNDVGVVEVSPEEFEEFMKNVFDGDKK